MLADCLHALDALGPGGLPTLLGALFLAGLAGGVTHCTTMCAPFVLAQAATGLGAGGGMLRRLAGAALLPYQAGRMLGYGALGALAGGAAGLLSFASGLRWVLAGLLGLAAVLMLAQAWHRLAGSSLAWRRLASRWLGAGPPRLGWATPRLPAAVQRRIGALLAAPTGWRGVLLGLLLSALPCGLLYSALAAAAASGSALAGGMAMVAFVAGTVPALTGVALLGRLFGRRQGPGLRVAGGVLFAFNGLVLAAMAVRLLA